MGFIQEIEKKRKKAIENSDKLYLEKFNQLLGHKANKLALWNTCLLFLLVILVVALFYNIHQTVIVHNNYQIFNKSEVIIKGDKEMVCLGYPNSSKVDCWRQET